MVFLFDLHIYYMIYYKGLETRVIQLLKQKMKNKKFENHLCTVCPNLHIFELLVFKESLCAE